MSSLNVGTTVQAINDSDSEEGNHPVSSPERPREISQLQQRSYGHPMRWESWPTGRPGPFVSEVVLQQATNLFHSLDSKRNTWSRTEAKVFHIAEFSSTGRSEFNVYHNLVRMTICPEIFFGHVTEPELATRLEVSIGSPYLLTYLSFIRNRTRRLVSDYCEQGQRFCAIRPISSTLDLQLPRRTTLQFTRPILGAFSLLAGRLPLYGPRSCRPLLRHSILSLTPGMEILFSASTLHPFIS